MDDILAKYDLKAGSHKSIEDGACIMELVSYMANEPWSDHPQCACPILTEYAIRMNDRFNDEHRQLLKPLVPLMIGTKQDDATQIARKRLIRWRNVSVTFPLILDLYKLDEDAKVLRSFGNTLADMAEAYKYLEDNRDRMRKTAYAYAYANATANAYAYADANATANADAYAYAYADAYANANALRQKIAEASVETLRLAIAVKV